MAAYNNVDDAKSSLSRLLDLVEQGEEVVIARYGTPVAKLVAIRQRERLLGSLKGRIKPETATTRPSMSLVCE
jgi:prevent-host-death family protein